jgi:hypothetical protein
VQSLVGAVPTITASTGLEKVGNDIKLGVNNAGSKRDINITNFGTGGTLDIFSSNTNASNLTYGARYYFFTNTSNTSLSAQPSYLIELSNVNNTNLQNTVISIDGRANYNDGFFWIKARSNSADSVLQFDTFTKGITDTASVTLRARNFQSGDKIQALDLYSNTIAATFTDSVFSRGLIYAGDYESNFVARSLVTKQYVEE